ncbi:RHS repeat-associated core domain-containing protein, partial [Asticcacaulis sp.]|uniref:RHS repeat-associated core domain-containing protein n=1 Tax=Asticcacaulis sp. TaxID=1872648 RepID=UPI00263441C6
QMNYDPEGRLASYTVNGATTTFLYDGVKLIAEYDGSGNIQKRYLHGIGTDDPWAELTGSDVNSGNVKYLYANYQGSVFAQANGSGTVTDIYKYGPYGEPKNAADQTSFSGSRFRYTGQTVLPEAQLYYYKARVYDPIHGRFLQADPIGSDDDLNLYAYTGGDPVNATDPDGMVSISCTVTTNEDGTVGSYCDRPVDDGDKDHVNVTVTHVVNATDGYGNPIYAESDPVTKSYSIYQVALPGGVGRLVDDAIKDTTGLQFGYQKNEGRENQIDFGNLTPSARKRLGNLSDRADETMRDVARNRGASNSNVRAMGHWADKTLKETAEAAAKGDASAVKALKIMKEGGRLGQKY